MPRLPVRCGDLLRAGQPLPGPGPAGGDTGRRQVRVQAVSGPAKDERGRAGRPAGGASEESRLSVPTARDRSGTSTLPRLLAALHDRLPEDRVLAWESVLHKAAGPDDPLLGRFIAAQSAVGLSEQLRGIADAWRTETPDLTGAGLALTLATLRAAPRSQPAQPVVSGPLSAAIPARLTSGVVQDVIHSAETSLLIASFAAYGAGDVVASIAQAATRGVHVDLLLEESTQASAAFAALPAGVAVWHRKASEGVLHAKLVAADRHTAFLGSANLTDRALTDNIELGVVLRDPAVVGPLVDHFRWLIAPENGVMRLA
ncbi:DISARM system phospholipase D-like protein DrmC [Streptomyces sp. NPDC059945]|uniref:DISARM system phospholipase D-like protein DrmC n=1 Tax=Streptomyces sp. NPDC059945 TaxID=3347012 RepID=UPI0036517CF1